MFSCFYITSDFQKRGISEIHFPQGWELVWGNKVKLDKHVCLGHTNSQFCCKTILLYCSSKEFFLERKNMFSCLSFLIRLNKYLENLCASSSRNAEPPGLRAPNSCCPAEWCCPTLLLDSKESSFARAGPSPGPGTLSIFPAQKQLQFHDFQPSSVRTFWSLRIPLFPHYSSNPSNPL